MTDDVDFDAVANSIEELVGVLQDTACSLLDQFGTWLHDLADKAQEYIETVS